MTDNELKAQIALGLVNPEDIEPILIWGVQDAELLHDLAKIFYGHLLRMKTDSEYSGWIPSKRRHDIVHENFLNNPNTDTKTRIYINQTINELRKHIDD